jgi:hypothetical protein
VAAGEELVGGFAAYRHLLPGGVVGGWGPGLKPLLGGRAFRGVETPRFHRDRRRKRRRSGDRRSRGDGFGGAVSESEVGAPQRGGLKGVTPRGVSYVNPRPVPWWNLRTSDINDGFHEH